MKPTIKLLNETKDALLLCEAFSWQDAAPLWFRQSQEAEDETLEEFLDTAEEKLLYGIFVDKKITALIRLTPCANSIFCIDLFAQRKTDWSVLCRAGLSLKAFLFDNGINGFFSWIPSRNRGIIKLFDVLGFNHNGIECYKGRYHNRPVKWLLMTGEKVV